MAVSIAVSAMLVLGGCAVNPATVPVPGSSVGGPVYHLTIQLSSALNLPARARVMSNGVRIGTLEDVRIVEAAGGVPGHIDARVEIMRSVRLPASTTAQLRQKTVLGDIYIALDTPNGMGGAVLRDDGIIGLAQTKPATQIEDLMARMSTFVSSGAIGSMQSIIDQTNAVLPETPQETARIFGDSGKDLMALAAHLDSLDTFLEGTADVLQTMLDRREILQTVISPEGATTLTAQSKSLIGFAGVVGSFGGLAQASSWMETFAHSAEAAVRALVPLFFGDHPLDLEMPHNMSKLIAILTRKVAPFATGAGRVDLTSVQVAPTARPDAATRHDTADVVKALRMIGLVR